VSSTACLPANVPQKKTAVAPPLDNGVIVVAPLPAVQQLRRRTASQRHSPKTVDRARSRDRGDPNDFRQVVARTPRTSDVRLRGGDLESIGTIRDGWTMVLTHRDGGRVMQRTADQIRRR
jgi:hypothetical protein